MPCWPGRNTAGAGAGTGWTSGATAIGPATSRRSARASGTSGGGAIGSSNRSTPTRATTGWCSRCWPATKLAPADPDVLRATGFLVRNRHAFNRNIWLDATVEHTAQGVSRPDDQLCPLPRPQVRSDSADRLLPDAGHFRAARRRIDRLPGQPDLAQGRLRAGYSTASQKRRRIATSAATKSSRTKNIPSSRVCPRCLRSTSMFEPVSLPPEAGIRRCVRISRRRLGRGRKALSTSRSGADRKPASRRTSQMQRPTTRNKPAVALAEARVARRRMRNWNRSRPAGMPILPSTLRRAGQHSEELAIRRSEGRAASGAVPSRARSAPSRTGAGSRPSKPKTPDEAKAKAALTKAEKDLTTAQTNLSKAQRRTAKRPIRTTRRLTSRIPQTSTGRRLALARWITRCGQSAGGPRRRQSHLAAALRRPLVENVFDFGLRSPRPAHAALLDWLAVELVGDTAGA